MRMLFWFSALMAVAGLGGCTSEATGTNVALRGDMHNWIETCRELAMRPADEPIGACESHCEYKQEYDIVFADEKYLSFKGDEWWYEGGAHGNGLITVGVIDRKSGRRLKLAELVPHEKWPKLQQSLYEAVVKKIGGKDQLQGEVKPIENFYVAKDGLHFLYNAYEVACYATGPVDVVVPFPFE